MEDSFVKALLSQQHLPLPVLCFEEETVESVARTICACLNGVGGWIVMGVDGEHRGVGIMSADFAQKIQVEITHRIMPLPLVYVHQEKYEGKDVVLVTIPKGSLTPYTYNGRYYVLQDDGAVVPSQDHLSQLLRNSYGVRSEWERMNNLYACEEDLDEALMERVYDKGLSLGRLTENERGLRGLLSELQMLKATEIANGTVALFARDIKHFLPQCRLRIQLMSQGKDAEQYEDLFFIEGNVFEVQTKSIAYFKDRLPRVAYFFKDRTGRFSDFEYPIEVLDEAISNALIHRDYTDIADEVTVFIYADRLEITNAGALPDKLVSGRNKVLPHSSVLRNPLMAEVFYVAGEMEKTGRGMLLISNTMKEAGRKLPEWTSANGRTTLTIYNRTEVVKPNGRIQDFVKRWNRGEDFSKADYMGFFEKDISRITALNDLQLMLKLGLCEKFGQGPSTRYKLV